jgi:ankyrin repeat protein/nucleoside phosphorylase
MAAARGMLDETHPDLANSPGDPNAYCLGRIGPHNMAIASLPSGHYGTNNAASVASNMARTYPSIRLRLLVGIGGGVPSGVADVRLGDVVVSQKIIQHDLGKIASQGLLEHTGPVRSPPPNLLQAVTKLQSDHKMAGSRISRFIDQMLEKHPSMTEYSRPSSPEDHLYDAGYEHVGSPDACVKCDPSRRVARPSRPDAQPRVHYGTIASGNQVLKHGTTRDMLSRKLNILCFEMEAAGLVDYFPCLVIRGICDYCDSHKNKGWQEYAAAAAAAYAKELLSLIQATETTREVESIELRESHRSRQSVLRKALAFDHIDGHQSSVKKNHSRTCTWILSHEEYLRWLDEDYVDDHLGFFWIKGKPGVGKSTLMNFLVKHSHRDESSITISFFFNARGDHLERSTVGMYRSVLYKLLGAVPELLTIFDSRAHKFELDAIQDAVVSRRTDVAWSLELLQSLLSTSLSLLGKRRLVIFIDALDECQDDEITEMIDFFQELGEDAIDLNLELRICFSSRHYPHVNIEHGQQLTLELQNGHKTDIKTYVRSKLHLGKSRLAEEIGEKITERASGIFMWVVLVVQILNSEYKDGRIHEVRKRLDAIPSRLSDLFRDILQRDDRHMDDFRLCVMWIIFARRPLALREFYFAVVSGTCPDGLRPWDRDEITLNDMERYVLSSSRGLAEVTTPTPTAVEFTRQSETSREPAAATPRYPAVVRFIHESVREFFLKDGFRQLWPGLSAGEFERISHERLARCCHTHVELSLPECQDHSAHQGLFGPAFSEKCPILRSLPFLSYSMTNGLWHVERSRNSAYQTAIVDKLCLSDWIARYNLTVSRMDLYDEDTSLLYVFAGRCLPDLVRIVLDKAHRIDIRGGRRDFPLFAAIAHGGAETVKALLYHRRGPGSGSEVSAMLQPPFLLEMKDQTPLAWAAACGLEQTLHALQSIQGVDRSPGRGGRTPLSWAAGNGHLNVARCLLDSKEEANVVDNGGRTPLSWAVINGHHAIVSLLLAQAAIAVNLCDIKGKTPLSLAATMGHERIVQLLLSCPGIEVDLGDGQSRTPLWWAAFNGLAPIVKLLLDTKSVDVNAHDTGGRTGLWWAANNGHISTVKVLLAARDVDPDTRDNGGKSALFCAVMNGHDNIAQLLLATNMVSDRLVGLQVPSLGLGRSSSAMRPRAIMDLIRKQAVEKWAARS